MTQEGIDPAAAIAEGRTSLGVELGSTNIKACLIGPDHRVLVPACVLGGGAYLVFCDVLARALPEQGEMPAGVITAMIGAPLFIYLLKKTRQ